MRPTIAICLLTIAAYGCRGLPLNLSRSLPADEPSTHEQLVFHTDFDLPREHRLVRELTAERDDVANTLRLPPSDERIHVHLFRDAETYKQFMAKHYPSAPDRRAIFIESDTDLMVFAHWSDVLPQDLRHEVAHGYLHASVPALPLWLDEGLAEFFEVAPGKDGLNEPHLDLLVEMIEYNRWKPNMRRLETFNSTADMQQIDYAESWAWVYFLLNSMPERRDLLTAYLSEMRQQGAIGPLSARLAKRHIEPEETLVDYLATLHADVARREVKRK